MRLRRIKTSKGDRRFTSAIDTMSDTPPNHAAGDVIDMTLLEKAVQGDAEALVELLNASKPALLAHVRPTIPAELQHRIDEDDILQETAKRACLAISDFKVETPGGFLRWLKRIAENVLFTETRRRIARSGKLRRLEGGENESGSTNVLLDALAQCRGVSPSQAASQREVEEAVHSALARLGDECEFIIKSFYLESRSDAEIARALTKVSDGAVRAKRNRCLKKLGRLLGTDSDLFRGA